MADAWQSAWVEVLPDLSNFRGEANPRIKSILGGAGDEGGREGSRSFGSSFIGGIGKLALPIAGAFAAIGIGNMIADAVRTGLDFAMEGIDIASGLNEASTAIDAVFGDGNAAIKDFAAGSARALGQSRLAALKAAQTFGVYGKAANLSGAENAEFSTSLVTLASDLASFYDATPEEAVEALGSGLRGEAEPLRRFGILLDDATLRNKALNLGLIATTKDALTPQQRVLAAQASILEQAGVATGDFTKTSGGLANQQRILAAQFEDSKAKLGEALLPAMLELTAFANDSLVPILDDVIDKVGPILADALTEAGPAFTEMLQTVAPHLPKLIELGAEALPKIIEGLQIIIPWLIETADKFGNGATQIITFFDELSKAEGWEKWANGAEQIDTFFAEFGGKLDNGAQQWQGFGGGVAEGWNGIIGAFGNGGSQIGGFFGFWAGALGNGATQWQGFGGGVGSVWGGITGAFSNGAGQIGGFFAFWAGSFANGAQQIGAFAGSVGHGVGEAVGFVSSLPGRAAAAVGNLGNTLVNSGRSLIQGFINGIGQMIGAVGNAVSDVVSRALDFFPNSPAKRGPLSGAGWNKLAQSGEAYITQWTSGFARPDLTNALSPVLSSVSSPVRSDYASTASVISGPRELVIVDADRKLIGRMQVEAGVVVAGAAQADDTRWRNGEKSL